MHSLLSWLSVAAAISSGVLWLYAALIKVPTKIESGYGACGCRRNGRGF
jgi:hypothetical protein